MINPGFCGEEKEVQSNSKFTELSVHCHIFQGSWYVFLQEEHCVLINHW